MLSAMEIAFATILRMRRLAIFVAFLFVGCSEANAQWNIEESNTTASLRGIHNVGGGVAWASGTNGTVGDHLYVREVWMAGDTTGYECPTSSAEKRDQQLQIAKNSTLPSNVELAANTSR